MTQWKLVPVEPTPEMVESAFGAINYTMPEPSEDAGRVYSAMLSAAPSPDGEEVAGIAGRLHEALGWFLNDTRFQVGVGGNPGVVESMIAEAHEVFNEASAAISAMRPAPKLSEEWTSEHQTSLVAAVYDAMWHWDEAPMDTDDSISLAEMLKDKLRENGLTLSLIDKLTEAG